MTRLKSTKAIFYAKLDTAANLLFKIDRQINYDYHNLNHLRGVLLRTKRKQTLVKFHQRLSAIAEDLEFSVPSKATRAFMLKKISYYKKQNSFLRYAATDHACIYVCIVFEEFIRRVLLKYFEEDVRRLISKKESIKNYQLVEIIVEKQNLHQTLAENVVDQIMYSSAGKWFEELKEIGMEIELAEGVKELFLIRNCIIHNDKRVSQQLADAFPSKYNRRKKIKLSIDDFKGYRDTLSKTVKSIIGEYNRLFPVNAGSWQKN